jgi:hypothetical protein
MSGQETGAFIGALLAVLGPLDRGRAGDLCISIVNRAAIVLLRSPHTNHGAGEVSLLTREEKKDLEGLKKP